MSHYLPNPLVKYLPVISARERSSSAYAFCANLCVPCTQPLLPV